MPRTPKPDPPHPESYAARAARGKPSVTIAMSSECKALLERLVAERGGTKGEAVYAALKLLAATPQTKENPPPPKRGGHG